MFSHLRICRGIVSLAVSIGAVTASSETRAAPPASLIAALAVGLRPYPWGAPGPYVYTTVSPGWEDDLAGVSSFGPPAFRVTAVNMGPTGANIMGFEIDDEIYSVNGRSVSDHASLRAALAEASRFVGRAEMVVGPQGYPGAYVLVVAEYPRGSTAAGQADELAGIVDEFIARFGPTHDVVPYGRRILGEAYQLREALDRFRRGLAPGTDPAEIRLRFIEVDRACEGLLRTVRNVAASAGVASGPNIELVERMGVVRARIGLLVLP